MLTTGENPIYGNSMSYLPNLFYKSKSILEVVFGVIFVFCLFVIRERSCSKNMIV